MRFRTFQSRGTAYYPDDSPMEGGYVDRRNYKLCSLQDYLEYKVPFVSCAMDLNVFPYGTELFIKELAEKYKQHILFRLVDTGGAFMGKGLTKIDICVRDKQASFDLTINKMLTVTAIIR